MTEPEKHAHRVGIRCEWCQSFQGLQTTDTVEDDVPMTLRCRSCGGQVVVTRHGQGWSITRVGTRP